MEKAYQNHFDFHFMNKHLTGQIEKLYYLIKRIETEAESGISFPSE